MPASKVKKQSLSQKEKDLNEVRLDIQNFKVEQEYAHVFDEYKDRINNSVPGEGSANAKLMFVGEAPGKNEDLTGQPFCGASGRILDECLSNIGLSRSDVFITSILKYRPPENRDPRPDEIKASISFLKRQIDIIDPKIIVLLGRFALNIFFPDQNISSIHGQMLKKADRYYLPIFHPATVLYNGKTKPQYMEEFSRLNHLLELIK